MKTLLLKESFEYFSTKQLNKLERAPVFSGATQNQHSKSASQERQISATTTKILRNNRLQKAQDPNTLQME
jgi:hypothetical protein